MSTEFNSSFVQHRHLSSREDCRKHHRRGIQTHKLRPFADSWVLRTRSILVRTRLAAQAAIRIPRSILRRRFIPQHLRAIEIRAKFIVRRYRIQMHLRSTWMIWIATAAMRTQTVMGSSMMEAVATCLLCRMMTSCMLVGKKAQAETEVFHRNVTTHHSSDLGSHAVL